MPARMTSVFFIIGALCLLNGCHESSADIRPGCYRLADGRPLFTVGSGWVRFKIKGTVRRSRIGFWENKKTGDFIVSPGFFLHDGRALPPRGDEAMPITDDDRKDGPLNYRYVNGIAVIRVPVETYGFQDVSLGRPC